MTISIFNQEIKLADIRKILKEASCNKSKRKLARSLANEIHGVSVSLELNGNLYKNTTRKYGIDLQYRRKSLVFGFSSGQS